MELENHHLAIIAVTTDSSTDATIRWKFQL